jgi:predicted nuclease with TOPRIM domain
MAGFVALQLVFDGILLFAVLFLFHYTVNRAQRRKDDENLLESLEVEEIKQDLQELLMTLKQVGSEASEGIQQKVREAEAKTKRLRELLRKVDADLDRISRLSQNVEGEKDRLDEKWRLMKAGQTQPSQPRTEPTSLEGAESDPGPMKTSTPGQAFAFSSDAVKEIYRLADASMEISEIARRTKLTRGEVQLILNLRGNRYTTPN